MNQTLGYEKLNVYRTALDAMVWFCAATAKADLPILLFRKLDTGATSIVLNLAEGNGRFSSLDHRRFLEVAYRAAVKLAAQLDLCVQRRNLDAELVEAGKHLLVRVASMTAKMARRE
jgi:four helix bundle protein